MFDILIPVYNTNLRYLEKCLKSVQSQTFQDWQCYIVDGSNNVYQKEIYALVETYLDDSRFHYNREQGILGQGASNARNQASRLGKNPYLAFLDSDDWWLENHLATFVDSIEKDSSERISFWFSILHTVVTKRKQGVEIFDKFCLNAYLESQFINPSSSYYYFLRSNLWPTGLVVLRTRFEQIGGFDTNLKYMEDNDLILRLCGDPRKTDSLTTGKFLNILTGYHRRHHNQLTSPKNLQESGEEYECNESIFWSRHPKFNQLVKPVIFTKLYWNWLEWCFKTGKNRGMYAIESWSKRYEGETVNPLLTSEREEWAFLDDL